MTWKINKTVELDLCISCGICKAVCQQESIHMIFNKGQFFPEIDIDKCINCGKCYKACPGVEIHFQSLYKFLNRKMPNNIFIGNVLVGYIGYTKNNKIRKNATSGGLITSILVYLIKKHIYDFAFVLDFYNFNCDEIKLKPTNDINLIIRAAKSKYIPASVEEAVLFLKENYEKKIIIVGTPCQITGMLKFLKINCINIDNFLFFGLFCDKTLNYNVISFYERIFADGNSIDSFFYRTKEKGGWPGDTKLILKDGTELFVDRSVRMRLKEYFQLNRCLYCIDKLNQFADISFGDCYIEGEESSLGKSNILVRSKKGLDIIKKTKTVARYKYVNIEKIYRSQKICNRKDNLKNAFFLMKEQVLYPGLDPNDYSITNEDNVASKNRINQIVKKITIGQEFIEKPEELYKLIGFSNNNRRNILIFGGQLFNKGAQSMVFTVVNEMKNRFPDKEIYLISRLDSRRSQEELSRYNFKIYTNRSYNLTFGRNKIFKRYKMDKVDKEFATIIKCADFAIDISGYALSSQFPTERTKFYLANIALCKKYNLDLYILPQSIGPFKYKFFEKLKYYPLFYHYLKYPRLIYARERNGYDLVKFFTSRNLRRAVDIVLMQQDLNLNNIYKDKPEFKIFSIAENSVGIIPNTKILEHNGKNDINKIYQKVISFLLERGRKVYIIRHSFEDLDFCSHLKNMFSENNNVILISDDLNSIELSNVLGKFDYFIASRYHSIIHAYKNKRPCLIMGWAIKYKELALAFGQQGFCFDIREKIDINSISNALIKLNNSYKLESEKIEYKINDLKKNNNIFQDIVDDFYRK